MGVEVFAALAVGGFGFGGEGYGFTLRQGGG